MKTTVGITRETYLHSSSCSPHGCTGMAAEANLSPGPVLLGPEQCLRVVPTDLGAAATAAGALFHTFDTKSCNVMLDLPQEYLEKWGIE